MLIITYFIPGAENVVQVAKTTQMDIAFMSLYLHVCNNTGDKSVSYNTQYC